LNVFKVDWRVPYFSRQSPVLAGSRHHRQEGVSCHAKVLPGLSFGSKVNYLKKYLVTWVQPQAKRVDVGERMEYIKTFKILN
jgi:hypothetical protein